LKATVSLNGFVSVRKRFCGKRCCCVDGEMLRFG
jgi:hypothetical protein